MIAITSPRLDSKATVPAIAIACISLSPQQNVTEPMKGILVEATEVNALPDPQEEAGGAAAQDEFDRFAAAGNGGNDSMEFSGSGGWDAPAGVPSARGNAPFHDLPPVNAPVGGAAPPESGPRALDPTFDV